MNAIILCGGLSTRLGDIAKTIPKVLLEIKGKTVFDWQLEKLKAVGIKKVVLAAGHLSEVLEAELGQSRQGIELIHAIEPERLGTGGAIKFAMDFVERGDEATIVLNGDILAGVDLSDMIEHLKPNSDGLILATRVEDAASYGTLVYDRQRHLQEFKEKEELHEPGYINGGFYIFNPGIKKYFPDQAAFSIEYDVFPKVKELYVYESDQPWIDVGVPERLQWARDHWGS